MQVRLSADAFFVNYVTALKSIEPHFCGDGVRFVSGDEMCITEAACRRCFETAVAPTAVEVETAYVCLINKW